MLSQKKMPDSPVTTESNLGGGGVTAPTYYAQINEKGIVQSVIVADQAFIDSGKVGDPTKWIPTDYSIPDKTASIGGKLDTKTGVFISPDNVAKYGDTVQSTDIIKTASVLPPDTSTST